MTNEEAIRLLQTQRIFGDDLHEAFDMAIKALKERKTGKWIFGSTLGHSWMKCSECCVSQDGQTACFTYCPHCGAKMEGAEDG